MGLSNSTQANHAEFYLFIFEWCKSCRIKGKRLKIWQPISACPFLLLGKKNFILTYNKRKNSPLRSMHTTQNHLMDRPSRLCQEATLAACQLSKPGRTSLYIGTLACIISAIPFPWDNNSPLTFKLNCCTFVLCFPLTLGVLLLFPTCRRSPWIFFIEENSATFINIFFHMDPLSLEESENDFSNSLSTSTSATKLFTVSAVISVAESAACSLKNWTRRVPFSNSHMILIKILIVKKPTFIILCLALRVFACCNHCWCLWKADLLDKACRKKMLSYISSMPKQMNSTRSYMKMRCTNVMKGILSLRSNFLK